MLRFEAVREAAFGRWPEVLSALGVPDTALRNKHGPCDGCGGDGFRFPDDDGHGHWFCSNHGDATGGDGFALLGHWLGWDKRRQLEEVARYLGVEGERPTPEDQARYAQRRAEARRRQAAGLRDRALLEELAILHAAVLRRQGPECAFPLGLDPDQARRASALWQSGSEQGDSPYLERKHLNGRGVRFREGSVLVPMRDLSGRLHGVQTISPSGEKRFPAGLSWHGLFHVLEPGQAGAVPVRVGIAEGYATAEAACQVGGPVACAFVAGNLAEVARALRYLWPRAEVVIWADWDGPEGGVGVRKARQAAEAVGGLVLVPPHLIEDPSAKIDWCDVWGATGPERFPQVVQQAMQAAEAERAQRIGLARERLSAWLASRRRGGDER